MQEGLEITPHNFCLHFFTFICIADSTKLWLYFSLNTNILHGKFQRSEFYETHTHTHEHTHKCIVVERFQMKISKLMKTKMFATETQAATNERINEHNNDKKNVKKER